MKKGFLILPFTCFLLFEAAAQKQASKVRYDTIIVKRTLKPERKKAPKPPAVAPLPVPEFMNQPYYFDKDGNRLIKLENATATLVTKKKALGLKGSKQFLSMEAASSKIRFEAKKEIVFFIKTSGDVIDLTSYVKLYQFVPADQKREVTVIAKEGLVSDKEEQRGKLIAFSVKMTAKDNYTIQLPDQLEAGEFGFVWMKNMELKEFSVFAFGIDWKRSD